MSHPDDSWPMSGVGPVPGLRRVGPDVIHHTTYEKAALCVAIEPHVAALAGQLRVPGLKSPAIMAEPPVVELVNALLARGRKLLRGEAGLPFVGEAVRPPVSLFTLWLRMGQLERAVASFRARYYIQHPLADFRPAWAVADAFGNPDFRWLGPPYPEAELTRANTIAAHILRKSLGSLAESTGTPLPPGLAPPKPAPDADDDDEPRPPPMNRNARRIPEPLPQPDGTPRSSPWR